MNLKLLLLLVFALSANSFADDAVVTGALFQWRSKELAGGSGQASLMVMPPQKDLPASKPGRMRVNVEPGCLLPDALVEVLPDNRCRFEFPDDDYFSRQARLLLGLKGKACIIRYKPGGKGQANEVEEITEVEARKPAGEAVK